MKRYSRIAVVLAVVVMASSFAAADDIGFTGNYATSNWVLATNGGNGSVDLSGAPNSIKIIGSDNGCLCYNETTFQTTAAYAATISFNWLYQSNDPDAWFDWGFYITVNGNQLLSGVNGDSGSISFNVNAGDVIGFGVASSDNIFGPGVLTISNFKSTAQVPEPATLFLMGTGLVGAAGTLRKRFAKA